MPHTIYSEIEIEAPLADVWAVLADLPSYPAWNPFTPGAVTDTRPGSPVKLAVRLAGLRFPMHEVVRRWEPPHLLSWGVTWGPLLQAERTQALTALGPNRTRYEATEPMTGPLAPLVMLLLRPALQRGFDANAAALREEVLRRKHP